ncbi:MAG: MFS transporter [Alphaproteobacteria bacterium]
MRIPGGRVGIVLALGTAQTLAWGSTYYLPAILAAPMAREYAVSSDWVFGAFSASLLLSALVGPAAGRRIDRFGGRDVLTVSSLTFAAGLTLMAASGSFAVLAAGWLLIGMGMGIGLYEAAFAALASIYRENARGAITGITLLAGFASTICWPISAYLDAEIGWRATCYVWAAAHLFLGLPLNRFSIPAAAPRDTPPPKASVDSEASLFNRPMLLMATSFAITWFVSTAMAAHLPALLEKAGASRTMAITAAALVGPAQVAARILEFTLLQRIHPLLSARIASVTHPVGALAFLGFGVPAAYFFALLHGAGNGVMTIAKGTLPLVIFGHGGYGRRQGFLAMPSRVSQAIAPFAFAVLFERYGEYALVASSALCLIGFAAMLSLRAAPARYSG